MSVSKEPLELMLVGNRNVEQARIQTEVLGGHVGQVDAETGGDRVVAHHAALDADVGLRAAGGDEGVSCTPCTDS